MRGTQRLQIPDSPFEVVMYFKPNGEPWTRIPDLVNRRASAWYCRGHNFAAAEAWVRTEMRRRTNQQQSKSRPKAYEDIDPSKPTEQELEAAKDMGFSRVPLNKETVLEVYKKLALKYHPDVTGGDEEAMKLINHCRDVLLGWFKRKAAE